MSVVEQHAIMFPEGQFAVDLGQKGASAAREQLGWLGDVPNRMTKRQDARLAGDQANCVIELGAVFFYFVNEG